MDGLNREWSYQIWKWSGLAGEHVGVQINKSWRGLVENGLLALQSDTMEMVFWLLGVESPWHDPMEDRFTLWKKWTGKPVKAYKWKSLYDSRDEKSDITVMARMGMLGSMLIRGVVKAWWQEENVRAYCTWIYVEKGVILQNIFKYVYANKGLSELMDKPT